MGLKRRIYAQKIMVKPVPWTSFRESTTATITIKLTAILKHEPKTSSMEIIDSTIIRILPMIGANQRFAMIFPRILSILTIHETSLHF